MTEQEHRELVERLSRVPVDDIDEQLRRHFERPERTEG